MWINRFFKYLNGSAISFRPVSDVKIKVINTNRCYLFVRREKIKLIPIRKGIWRGGAAGAHLVRQMGSRKMGDVFLLARTLPPFHHRGLKTTPVGPSSTPTPKK